MDKKTYDMYKFALKLKENGDVNGSIKILRKLYRLNPNDKKIKNIFSCLLLEKEETKEEGINLLEEAVNSSNSTESLNALFYLGEFYYKKFYYDESLTYFNLFIEKTSNVTLNEALEKKLNFVILHVERIHMHKNNFIDAEINFKKLLNTKISPAAFKELTFIKIREESYEEAYNYYLKLINKKSVKLNQNLERINIYLKYKLGLLNEEDIIISNYFYSQLTNYDCNYALSHIKGKHNCEPMYENSKYNNNISISDLYDCVKLIINNENPTFYDISDVYLIEFNYIVGNANGKDTNIVEVTTLPNTKNILSMYPTGKNFPISIKAYKEKEKPKINELKRESQIDKFNRRYGSN